MFFKLIEIEGNKMKMSFREVFDTPTYMDEPEPTGDKWRMEAFESFLDTHETKIEFLIESKESTKKLIDEKSFTEEKWANLITKIRKIEDDIYYYAETFSYKGWDIDLCNDWHKFWYAL